MFIMNELTEKTNELTENTSVTDLIDKQRNILAKSKVLKLSNLANRMTPIQNAIFSLALRNVEINGNQAITEISVAELLELIDSSEYSSFKKTAVARDKKAIQENHINLIQMENHCQWHFLVILNMSVGSLLEYLILLLTEKERHPYLIF